MINKEFILNADGTIKKDFQDRNIPQYANNQVSVNVLIPASCFTGLQNYAVILGVSRIVSGVETTLNSLVMTASKSITLDGVLYVKYSAILSYSYTELLGTLKVSPYIQTTATTTIEDESVEVISIQQSFTNSNLNVIKSVLPQYDASMQEADVVSTIEAQLNAKKIYTFIDSDASSLGEHYYNLASSYNPNATQFEGCLVMSIYDNETRQYMPYLNDGDVELLEITKDGKFYRISGVDYDSGTSTYTYTRLQLSYSKGEIDTNFYKKTETYNKVETDALLNDKVDKTTTINDKPLSSDVVITKGDVGLGNVANFGVESATPTASGDQLYITSKAVYDALQVIYGILANMPTEDVVNTINSRLDAIETLIGDNDGDDDNIINTLKEIIDTLSGLGEDANILSMINSKVSQTDFNTLDNQINGEGGIKDKVDILTSQDNAYMEIKAQSGTIDIEVSDWVANSDAYSSEYPYKWTLTNGYLEGATNVIVVFSIDSDTSMLSATTQIDEENGVLTIYASETPLDTIKIEKIAVFNSLDAYINYSNTIVQQVLQNTTAISDINNTKLPQYVKERVIDGTARGMVFNDVGMVSLQYLDDINNPSHYGLSLVGVSSSQAKMVATYKANDNTITENIIKVTTSGASIIVTRTISGVETSHTLTFDTDGKLIRDNSHYIEVRGCYTTTTQPTLNGAVYVVATADVVKLNSEQFTSGRLLFYKDNSGKILEIYSTVNTAVVTINNVEYLALQKIGEFSSGGGGGSQLYKHCITATYTGSNYLIKLCFEITNDNNTLLNSQDKIGKELYDKGIRWDSPVSKAISCSGFVYDSTHHYGIVKGIYGTYGDIPGYRIGMGQVCYFDGTEVSSESTYIQQATFTDTVITL